MASTYFDWDATWTDTSINSSSITDTNSSTTAAISNDQKVATEVSVDIDYGGTTDEGVFCYVLRDVNGTDFEAVDDRPFGFEMPFSSGNTRRRTFVVAADRVSKFKVQLVNNTGATVTASVKYRQAISTSA